MSKLKGIAVFMTVFAILGGCAETPERAEYRKQQAEKRAENRMQQEAAWRSFVQECTASGRVIYGHQCLTQEQAFVADQAERNRRFSAEQAQLDRKNRAEHACISRGGVLFGGQCIGGTNDINVNIR